jgi:DNA-binding response OmpR family regulator
MIALVIEDYLRENGFLSCDIAATETEAVQWAAHRCPDLITSDVRLAEGCGIAAVQTICACHSVAVLFITATPRDLIDRLPDAAVLAKPFTADALDAALNGL